MRTTTHSRTTVHAHKRNGRNGRKLHTSSKILKPIKRANKKIITYVTHKPTQTLGIATLLTGLCVSVLYARRLFK